MGHVTPSQMTDGTTHTAAQHNNQIDALADEFNGNIDDSNIKVGAAIDPMKLAASEAPFTVEQLASPQTNLQAEVATGEATSTGYATDLTTPGPSQTVTIGQNGRALVIMSAFMSQNTSTAKAYMGVALSGANTIAADTDRCISYQAITGMTGDNRSGVFLFEGLTPGATTFEAKYGTGGGGAADYADRRLAVIPL